MLLYLDGITNAAAERNENFGRECLELFTMGRDGGYTQDDVVAASRAFTGWVVDIPGRPTSPELGAPWTAVFLPRRHDAGAKTLLGTTGPLDIDGALDVMLEQPATARFVATKLYRELVGRRARRRDRHRDSARRSARDYEIMPLVEAIAQQRRVHLRRRGARRSTARRSRSWSASCRRRGATTPRPRPRGNATRARRSSLALRAMSSLPFVPPNVGGFPKGERLSGPSNLVHTFDLLQVSMRRRTGREVGRRPVRALRRLRRERHHARGRERRARSRPAVRRSSPPRRSSRSHERSCTRPPSG